jgi:ferredoxin
VAERIGRWEDNAEGRFYTDKECILCSLCADVAPHNFCESSSGDHDIVYKQPQTSIEERQCMEALAGCPVNAIGLD